MNTPPAKLVPLVALIVAGAFLAGLGASLVNAGLAEMVGTLNASLPHVQWVARG